MAKLLIDMDTKKVDWIKDSGEKMEDIDGKTHAITKEEALSGRIPVYSAITLGLLQSPDGSKVKELEIRF